MARSLSPNLAAALEHDDLKSNNPPFHQAEPGASPGGCIPFILVAAMAGWVGLLAIVCQGATWLWEQMAFGGPPQSFDPRWLIGLAGSLMIWIPLIGLEKAWQKRYQGLVRPVRLAAELVILMIPARFLRLTDSQAVSIWQIAALGLFLARLAWVSRSSTEKEDFSHVSQKLAIAAAGLSGGVLLLPWAVWGALGSPLDTFLGASVALLTGLAAARLISARLQEPGIGLAPGKIGRRLDWLTAAITMIVVAMALGLNGNEWLLLISFPALGWLGVAFRSMLESGQRSFLSILAPGLALGLAVSGPLVWIDPDELNLVVSSGRGELIGWGLRVGLVTAALTVVCALAVGMIGRAAVQQARMVNRTRAVGVIVWLALVGVYLLAGRPGWYGEQIFVILKEQPNVAYAKSIQDYPQRRKEVYQTLTSRAEHSQAELRQIFDRWGIHYTPYYLVNGLEVNAGPLVRAWLLTRPEVDRVLDSPHLRPLPAPLPAARGSEPAPTSLPWNLDMLQANLVWNELKVTGQGIIVGQSDSGVDGQHPELAAAYLGSAGQNDSTWFDPWFHSREPVDIGGHGTHTLGSILGRNVGVAPGAKWIGCVNLGRNLGNPALYLDCMQFMLAPFPQNGDPFKDGQPERGAHVLNNSWGCPVVEGCDAGTFAPAVQSLAAAGIFVVVSAGNDGETGCGSLVDPPAIYAEVFSVGAVDSSGNRASFSSMGPVNIDGSQRSKPDLVAPGQAVLSAFPGGTYAVESGTSMAGPQVVGVVALMWSANSKLVGDIDQTRKILDETAKPYPGTILSCGLSNTVGYGIVNAYRAVQAVQNIK